MKKNNMFKNYLNSARVLLLFLFVFIFLFSTSDVVAQAPILSTASATTTAIDQIKDKIASKVAEISADSPIIFRGKVQNIKNDTKTFDLSSGDKTYSVSYLSGTSYFWLRNDNKGRLSLNFSNVENDDEMVVLGNLIRVDNQISAKTIYGRIFPKVFIGEVVSTATGKLIIKTISSNTDHTIDTTGITNISELGKDNKNNLVSLSSLKEKDLLLVYGTLKSKSDTMVSAIKISLIQK
jgi:hypothetical protein